MDHTGQCKVIRDFPELCRARLTCSTCQIVTTDAEAGTQTTKLRATLTKGSSESEGGGELHRWSFSEYIPHESRKRTFRIRMRIVTMRINQFCGFRVSQIMSYMTEAATRNVNYKLTLAAVTTRHQ